MIAVIIIGGFQWHRQDLNAVSLDPAGVMIGRNVRVSRLIIEIKL
jgi:hypothetical protein